MRYLLTIFFVFALSGCASLKITDRDRQFQLARAEPLFGRKLDHCLNNPAVLFEVIERSSSTVEQKSLSDQNDRNELRNYGEGFVNCGAVVDLLVPIVRAVDENKTINVPVVQNIRDEYRRDEIIEALIAISNRKCGDYAAYLKTHDGQVNSSLSILALLTGSLGTVVGGEGAAQALSGSSAFFTGSRSALNETWFSSQTIHVLAAGFEKARERELRNIRNRQACPMEHYGTMAGIGDAINYHRSCSLLTGLSEAAEAIERADQPGMDTLRRQLVDLQSIRAQAKGLDDFVKITNTEEEQSLITSVGEATKLQASALARLEELEDNLDELREAQRIGGDAAGHGTAEQIEGLQADVESARTFVSDQTTLVTEARDKLTTYYAQRDAAVQQQTQAAGDSGELQGSQSQKTVCPYTGKPKSIIPASSSGARSTN